MNSSVWQDFISYMFKTTTLTVPTTFIGQVKASKKILNNDYSSLVTSIFDFAINVADVDFKFETDNENLTKSLNKWKNDINEDFRGRIPTGLKELAKEYFKERWTSSLIVMNVTFGEPNEEGLILPKKIWILDSAGVKVTGDASKLGNFGYQVKVKNEDGSKEYKTLPLDKKATEILVQKPFGRWYDKYPVPYLVRKGTLVSCLLKQALKENSGKVLDEIIPYIILMKRGTEKLFLEGVDFDDAKLEKLRDRFKTYLEKKKEAKETGVLFTPFDTELQEFIPDLIKVFNKKIYEEIDRDILSSLGLVEVVEGVGASRRESIVNPAPFREEVKQGVEDFKSLLADLIKLIIDKNKDKHRKWMKVNIQVTSSPIKGFVTSDMLAYIRSAYDRGDVSRQTFVEYPTGLNYALERDRRIKEAEAGDSEIMHPPIIVNKEGKPVVPDFTTPEEEEVKKVKKKSEKEIKKADLAGELNITCEVCDFSFDTEFGLKNDYAKCPLCDSILDKDGKLYFVASLDSEKSLEATLADLVQAPVEITERYIRIRQKNPSLFQKNSFRTITLGKGIKAIIGRLKGQKTTTIQSYLFDKTIWTLKEAKKWIKEHKK